MIDTAAKRASVLSLFVATVLIVPVVGVAQADQQTCCHVYGGILATVPPPPPPPPPAPPVAPGNYDLIGAIHSLMPGAVLNQALLDAATAAWAAKGYVPLVAGDVTGILAAATNPPLPSYPAGLPRIPDSNPSPLDGWVKYLPNGESP